ncbi:SRPBCC family protein [Polynucleobacter sp. CS-Odin-A6]|uniref:SRPBCC family protein n=1 Tax=Polynucleobacter sp. CS-Odin-A6 TaxID=2689106 RepID=UPI001C0C22FF|nr:SRPBCC family protein [Polynucleobacter sp. CS-Odin-A6]MBU3620005.1 cyclase/dehydrase [Polynucleobacter sp. CS-Odin-A6]
MKWLFSLMLVLFVTLSHAEENANPFDIQVSITPINGRFQINASYVVPINICSAYSFITDYEGSKNIPGIIEATVISRAGNKVRVRRVIEEEVLFFHISMKSLVEYTETPNELVSFEQLSGDAKFYKGAWKLVPNGNKTTFKYNSLLELDSIIPSVIVEYFMKNNMRGRLGSMALRASQQRPAEVGACK